MKQRFGIATLVFLSTAFIGASAEDWNGSTTVNKQLVPIHLSLSQPAADGSVTGSFLNGPEKVASSSGTLKNGHLILNFDYFARKLEGDIKDGKLAGTYSGARGTPVVLTLEKDAESCDSNLTNAEVSKISGDWEVAVKSAKGESAWTLRVTPAADNMQHAKAVVLRIDGDTGGLYGGYNAATQQYRFAHFSAAGAALYGVKLADDGTVTLTNLLRDGQQWTARRPAEARKENLTPPTKSTEQTTVVDPSQPLAFSAPDLSGNIITNADPRFANKVVIVAIGGSWCPNCHDEAPLLVELYNRYHTKGLEIVSLSFEEEDQLKDPARLRAFKEKYGITYPVLVAGTPDQLSEKLPQGKNLNCWPTAFFVGRDGLVKEAHAGFSGPATGQSYIDLKAETEHLVESLLKQPAPKQTTASASRAAVSK
jgi:thiol-disulfide isomerase/thioredoxin